LEVLAKSNGQTLSNHVEECLRVARVILASLPLAIGQKKMLANDLELAIAFHDVGKAATGFQKMLLGEMVNWGYRHEILSASFISSANDVNQAVIFAVLTHHKSIPETPHGEK
jgi:CRISPR-associated endonuclease/helicase Cas3